MRRAPGAAPRAAAGSRARLPTRRPPRRATAPARPRRRPDRGTRPRSRRPLPAAPHRPPRRPQAVKPQAEATMPASSKLRYWKYRGLSPVFEVHAQVQARGGIRHTRRAGGHVHGEPGAHGRVRRERAGHRAERDRRGQPRARHQFVERCRRQAVEVRLAICQGDGQRARRRFRVVCRGCRRTPRPSSSATAARRANARRPRRRTSAAPRPPTTGKKLATSPSPSSEQISSRTVLYPEPTDTAAAPTAPLAVRACTSTLWFGCFGACSDAGVCTPTPQFTVTDPVSRPLWPGRSTVAPDGSSVAGSVRPGPYSVASGSRVIASGPYW